MDELEWSECGETLDDLLKNPRVQLPQIIKLSSNIKDVNTNEGLEKGQYVVIHAKETIERLHGTDTSGKSISIPFKCPFKLRRKVTPGKEKVFESITDIAKTEPLPKFVEVKSLETEKNNISVGDRLKVVIVEKSGGAPSFIHFRSSAGKHIKLSVEDKISFQLSVNDGSEQLVSKLAEKSKEFPLCAEFAKKNELPKSHSDIGIFTIKNSNSENIVIASAKKNESEFGVIFPLHANFKFQVNSKLKMAKDDVYRELCMNASEVNVDDIKEFVNHHNPTDKETMYIVKYRKLSKILKFDYTTDTPSPLVKTKSKSEKSNKEKSKQESTASESNQDSQEENNEESLPPNTLTVHSEQKEIMKRELKERERQAKLEKERKKAEKKKKKEEGKKEKKEREKDKKKKKSSSSLPSSPIEQVDEDLYIVPSTTTDDNVTIAPTPDESQYVEDGESSSSQFAMYLMNKVKKVRDRTQSLGNKKQKKRKLRKEDIEYVSSDNHSAPTDDVDVESMYTGLHGDPFEESLYESLPCDMAYESLDLVAQAQRSLSAPAPVPAENSGDSGFDEIDQARIKAWRDAMVPPPLPGNHPVQQSSVSDNYDDENLYEMAVDSHTATKGNNLDAWQNFYDSVQQSTKEIAAWDMEDVANCLSDLQLGNYSGIFSDSQIDGHLLLDLDESVLKDLGLSAFEARKLRKFVFGWRPDMMRPPTYPTLKGFESKDPADWSKSDVVSHLRIIEINDFAEFCDGNQVNGELLKDICVDENIMSTIITTKDRKIKSVKIKNYVIDQWRPKKKGEGNYTNSNSILPPEKRGKGPQNTKASVTYSKESPQRKVSDNYTSSSMVLNKKSTGDSPLIAKMKQQLEENKNSWEQKKKPVDYI